MATSGVTSMYCSATTSGQWLLEKAAQTVEVKEDGCWRQLQVLLIRKAFRYVLQQLDPNG